VAVCLIISHQLHQLLSVRSVFVSVKCETEDFRYQNILVSINASCHFARWRVITRLTIYRVGKCDDRSTNACVCWNTIITFKAFSFVGFIILYTLMAQITAVLLQFDVRSTDSLGNMCKI
jgi:hypothetical protein